jgi:hypothetical protein
MPKRQSRAERFDLSAVVYQYESRHYVDPEVWEAITGQLHLANDLRNHLVQIERKRDQAEAGMWNAHPQVGPLLEIRDDAEEAQTAAYRELQAAKQHARTSIPDPVLVAAYEVARDRTKAARLAYKEARDAARPHVRPQLRAIEDARRADIKGAYTMATQQGLHWATVNDKIGTHATAVSMVIKRRTQGQRAQMNFSRWEGTGTLRVQLQRESTDPDRTMEMLASDTSKWRNVAALDGVMSAEEWAVTPRRDKIHVKLRFRIGQGTTAQHVVIPIRMHRQLPAGADVTDVRVTCRRTGPDRRLFVQFTCLIPKPPVRTEGYLVAAHLGWRRLPADGAIRAAVTTLPPGLELPADLAHIGAVRTHGTWAELVMPPDKVAQMEKIQDLQSKRDKHLGAAVAWLAAWLNSHPGYREVLDPASSVAQWRSPRRLIDLLRDLKLGYATDPALAEVITYLQEWQDYDDHLWKWAAHGTAKVIRWRKDAYRHFAAWLTSGAAMTVVDSWTIPNRLPSVTEADTPQAQRARYQARLASPGLFRSDLETASSKRGVHFVEPDHVAYDQHVGSCGGELAKGDRAKSVMVECAGCGNLVDQDVNALMALTAAGRNGQVK